MVCVVVCVTPESATPRPLAHWMRPAAEDRPRTVRFHGLVVRLAGLTLTVLLVAAACEVALDLAAWQCAGVTACARRHTWLGLLSPAGSGGGWWSAPGRRLALAALVPTALTGLLRDLSHRTWSAYESTRPLGNDPEPGHTSLGSPGFWYGRRRSPGCVPPTPRQACSPSPPRSSHRRPPSTAGRAGPPYWTPPGGC